MPTLDTALVYPGMCLFEATNVSEGRGTTRPFEIFGAPFIHPETLVNVLKEFKLPGVVFRPLSFQPTFQKHAGLLCGGAQIHVTDREKFKPFKTGVAILKAIHNTYPARLQVEPAALRIRGGQPPDRHPCRHQIGCERTSRRGKTSMRWKSGGKRRQRRLRK